MPQLPGLDKAQCSVRQNHGSRLSNVTPKTLHIDVRTL